VQELHAGRCPATGGAAHKALMTVRLLRRHDACMVSMSVLIIVTDMPFISSLYRLYAETVFVTL
jgi:hypothetical protein